MLGFLGTSPPSVDDVTHAPGCDGHALRLGDGPTVRVGRGGEYGLRGGGGRRVGRGGPGLMGVMDNLLVTHVTNLLRTLLLESLLLDSLVFVFASRKRNYS